MTALDVAIEAAGGQYQSRVTVTWPGGTNPIFNLVCDVSIDRSIQDQPISVTQIAGAAAAQATITLKSGDGTYLASMLSPFSTNAWSTRNVNGYGVGAITVVIEEGVLVSGSYTYTTLFTGTVTNFALGDDGSATLTCIDRSSTIQGTVNLPAAGGAQSTTLGDTRLNPLAVVDLALRSGGYYLTPAPWGGTGSVLPAPILSVPGIGSSLPEVGGFVSGPSTSINVASPWPTQLPTVDVQKSTSTVNCSIFRCSAGMVNTPSKYVLVNGWFYVARPGAGTSQVLVLGDESSNEVQVHVNTTGTVALQLFGSPIWTSTGTIPTGPSWVQLFLILSESSGYLSINGATWETVTTSTPAPLTGLSQVRLGGGAAVLGLQIANDVLGFTGLGTAPPVWTPNYTASLDSVPQRLSGIARQTGSAWSMVQQVAQAYGDVAYWDGAGAFRYETRATWAARRFATPTYLKDDSRIMSGAPSWGQDSLRRSVSASVVVPTTAQSTTAAPAYVATEIYTVPARSNYTFAISLDYAVFDLKTPNNGWQTDANSSWFRFVRADAVNDPAAALVGGVGVSIAANASGLVVSMSNNNPFAVATWTPGDGGSIAAGPYMIIHGKTVTFPGARALTVSTGALVGDDLTIEDNPWRQDDALAQVWVNSIASDVSLPQIIWGSLQVPIDPRLTIGSVVTVKDSPYMDVSHPVQIVGIGYDMPADGMHTATLTIRSAYPPTGPIVGLAGRDVVGSSLVLVA